MLQMSVSIIDFRSSTKKFELRPVGTTDYKETGRTHLVQPVLLFLANESLRNPCALAEDSSDISSSGF
jgi:hypothetical protein